MDNRMDNVRKKWIDMTRAIGIFAIVYGHMVQGESCISQFFGSFRVAIFFSVMGLTFQYKKGFRQFIKKKAVRLLIPYYVFAVLSIFILYFAGRLFPVLTESQSTDVLKNIWGALYANGLTGYMKWNLPLWFLPCSFVTSILIYCFESFLNSIANERQQVLRVLYILLSFIVGFFYSRYIRWLKLPFGFEVAIPMSGFFEMGILCTGLENWLSRKLKGFIGGGLIVLGFFLSIHNGYVSVMSLSFGYSTLLYYFTAIISIVGIELLSLSNCARTSWAFLNRILCYCGAHTLAILCMHKFPVLMFQYVVPITKDILLVTTDSVKKNLIGFLLAVIVIALCLIAEKAIDRFCPIIFGHENSNTKYKKHTGVI